MSSANRPSSCGVIGVVYMRTESAPIDTPTVMKKSGTLSKYAPERMMMKKKYG